VKRVLFALFWLALSGSVSAQVTSRLGRFQVDKVQGCAPFTVTITNTNLITTGECTAAKPCIMTFEGTTQQQNVFTYVYNTPGTYTLQVLYQSIGADDIVITVDQNIQPDFEVYRCSGNDVTIKVTDNKYEQYVINWGDSSPEVAIPFSNNAVATHDYPIPPPASFNIAVRGRDSSPNAADNCTAKTETVTTLATLPQPSINTLTATGPTSVRLALPAGTPTFILYKLEIAINNGATFQVLQNVYGQTSIDVSNLLLDNNYYCFRLSAFDPCTNANRYSNIVCTQDFDVNFTNGTNRLTWRTATAGIGSVTITRKNMSDNTTQTTTLPGAPLAHNDVDYDCNIQYCYSLSVNYAGIVKSHSLEKCGVGILTTTHPAIEDVLATVTTGVNLKWEIDPLINLNEFQVLRSTLGAPFVPLTTTTDTDANDPSYTTEGAHCYKINYNDVCDNNSADGAIICPVRLTGTLSSTNITTLTWTKYKGWKNGVASYTVEKLRPNGTVLATFPVALDTFFIDDTPDPDNQIVSYRVRVVASAGTPTALSPSVSNIVTFTKEINLTFPTAFTPNGDGLNDVFTISGHYVTKMNIRIFDRWGGIVFASEKNDAWNGSREGTAMPESSYVWKAEITDQAGRSFSRDGTLLLLRK
jgi:gliding motility-associated-like protein